VKTLISGSRNDFDKELASLLHFQSKGFEHLVKLLVTFERLQQKGTASKTYHFVFPWAEGTLSDFWKLHDEPTKRASLTKWMAKQCYGLAVALSIFHNARERHLSHFPEMKAEMKGNSQELFGRHGDIKADNILWYNKLNILTLNDFGLGSLHTWISRSNVNPKALDRTATFRAPEFDTKEGLISRAADIFSLGCTFLEFVTWHLKGWKSVDDDFAKYRFERDQNKFLTDTFFRLGKKPDGGEIAEIKPKVKEWITMLKDLPNCTQYHIDFLKLIQNKMLEPDPEKRIKTSDLVKKLEVFTKAGDTDSTYDRDPADLAMNSD
jgi:serine/threonine protein kinase